MPLDALRLRDSELALESTAEVFRASVLLWCASWHQVPAGSLPSKDKTLAEYSRAGKRWSRIRDDVMSRWLLCSDGRFYHPVVAEKALEAQAAKDARKARTKAATEAADAKRKGLKTPPDDPPPGGGLGGVDGMQSAEPDAQRNGQRDVQRDVPQKSHQGKGREGKGIEDQEKEMGNPLAAVATDRPPADRPQLELVSGFKPTQKIGLDCPHAAILAIWAEELPQMPQPKTWTPTRAGHLRARWRESAVARGWTQSGEGLAHFRKLFRYVGKSPFLTGRSRSEPGRPPFIVELPWLLKPENYAKVIEGKYHAEEAAG